MAGLIKNQILKHLSKFTKNLSPDKIKVSTLKGEGDLSNLELDEKVLTELLDLPTWLTLSKAVCNRVAIKIQWTKLKTQPICVHILTLADLKVSNSIRRLPTLCFLSSDIHSKFVGWLSFWSEFQYNSVTVKKALWFLDEIEVEMETCENIRNPSAQSPLADLSSSGKYGLAERIVDGMYVSINSVVVNFKAKAFHASIQLSRIIIQSKTPIWDRSGDLRTTRIKDEIRGEMLLFKEAEWQTLRIEANALDGSNLATTPLRLIANQSKIRITIKKRLMDCGIVASRLLINLDDLLWVLTDSQLKAAFAFINSLKDVIKKSAQQSKLLAADKIRKQGFTPSRQTQQTAHGKSNRAATKSEQAITKLFNKYDIGETSYHLHSGRIDLHLCEDPSSDEDVYRKKVEGGAIQMTFLKMCFDYYPFHPAGAERTHWLKYDENMAARDTWATELMQSFRDDVRKVRNAFSPSQQGSPTKEAASSSSQHSVPPPPSGGDKNMTGHQHHQQQTLHVNGVGPGSNPPPLRPTNLVRENHASPAHQGVTSAGSNHGNQPQQHKGSHQASFQAATKHTRLLENSFIFRLEDFVVFQVSSATDSRRRAPPRKFLSSEKKQLWLPQEMSSLHMEYTDYYFPEGIDFPGVVADGVPSLKDKEVHSNVQGALTDDYLACVPHANLYVVINPIKVTLDYLTLLWLNAFSLNISNSLNIPEQKGPTMHTDIRLDALMPRLIVPGEEQEYPEQIDRPTSLQLQLSRVVLTNCRLGNRCARTDLRELLDAYSNTKLLHKEEFPCCKKQLDGLPSCISNHANRADNAYFDKIVEDILLDRELPGSFSEQRLDELLVNSYSQRNSSPSNKGDNIHSGDKPTTGTSNTTVTHTLQQQQQQQLADQQCKKQSTDTNQSSHHHSSITSTGSSNTMNNSSSISSNNHGNSSIIGITNKANTTMTNTGESETRNGSSNSSNNKRKPLTNQDSVSSVGLTYYNMRTNSFKKDRRKDVWCAVIDQVWVEFLGAPSARGRPLPLVESFPLTLWMALPKASQEADREHGTTGRGTNADLGNQFKAKAVDGMTTGFTKKNHEQAAGAAMMADKDGQGMTDMDSGEGSSKTDQSVDKVTADLHVIAKVGGQVHLQISHYQYLFLMRTIETVTNFQNELQHDTQLILNEAPPPQKSVGLSVMLQEVELALVCLPNKDEFANDDSSVSNSSDLTQEEPATMTTEDTHQTPQRQSGQDSALGASFQSQKNGGLSKSHSDPELLSPTSSDEPQIDELVRLATSAMAASDTNLEMADRKTSVQSFMSRQTTTDSIAPGASLASISSLPSRENSSPAICISETGPSSQHYESPLGSSRGTPSDSPAHTARDPHQQHRRAGEVKKSLTTGISNLGNKFSNLGSKLKDKVNMNKRDFEMEEGEDWETVSVQSSDDEDYMMLKYQNEEELPAFDKQYGGVTEAGSDDNSQVIDIAKTTRGTVSVVTFKLYHVEAFVQLVDKDIKLATQVDHVIPEELGNIDLDKFQERFSAGTNTLSTDIPSPLPESPIQLSFSQGPQAEQLAPTAGDRGFLHCKVKGLHTRLPLAGLTSLTDLIEDEKHAPVIPLLAEITDSFITLQDSRSTTYATSVEKIPIDLHISKLAARRTEDGVFHLMGETLPSDLSLDAKYWKQKCIQTTPSIEHPPTARTINYVNLGLSGVPSLRKEQPQAVEESVVDGKNYKGLLDENEQLRRQLERIGKLSSQTGGIDAKSLESLQKECEHLKSKANKADRLQRENRALMEQLTRQVDDIFTMKEERESLLATIQMLQEELAESEQMRMAALKKTPK